MNYSQLGINLAAALAGGWLGHKFGPKGKYKFAATSVGAWAGLFTVAKYFGK